MDEPKIKEENKIEINNKEEFNNNKANKKYYNYSKSPTHINKNINNKKYNITKINKPFLTSRNTLLEKHSLKEVNECIYKDYNQIANILPYYQNYYFQNKIYSNKNSNNDSVLICLKYIEYTNFFFNIDISYKIQNLLFNIINNDRGFLNQNEYLFLRNKLNETYNKLIPYQIRYNYLKAFFDRNAEENLYYLFKSDLDKINLSKTIGIKHLNYLNEIFEIVKSKLGTKKESIKSYINKLYSNNISSYNYNKIINNNINNLIANNIYNNINNIQININGNINQNNLMIQKNNGTIPKKMKINLPSNNNNNPTKEEDKENKENQEDKKVDEINNMDFLYNSEENKENTSPKIIYNDIENNNNSFANFQEFNIIIKQIISSQNYLTTNINKYISQYTQLNQNSSLYISFIVSLYNQGIINNILFSNQNNTKNNSYNNNINILLKQEKIIETDYEKLNKLKKENPSKISDNLKLFENYILLPIYNEINSNNNTPVKAKLYSEVYFKYKEIINSVIIKNNLEGTIVEPYGSIVNNFLTSDGDIDISIVPNNISKIGFRIYLEQIEKELIKNNLIQDTEEINDVNINNNSRIYISTRYARLSVTDIETNINIDITVHNILPIKNTKMIRLYSLFDQRFHILGIFLKHWVKINNIKGAPNKFLSSYALLLLIIHFLQDVVHPKILPMLQEIISKEKNKEEFNYKYFYDDKEFNTNLYFEENFDNMKEYMNIINCGEENTSSVSELLVQFFEYYGYVYNSNNNNKHYLISIKHSDKNYVANNTEYIAFPLEDPFDVNHNPSSTLKLNTSQYSEFIFCIRKEINNILSGEYFK